MAVGITIEWIFFHGQLPDGAPDRGEGGVEAAPCQLELGGKDPLYVMDDVKDIAQVAGAALEGWCTIMARAAVR